MKISNQHYDAIEKAYVESARAVDWAYAHWDLDTGIERALKDAMGEGVAKSLVDLLKAVEEMLENGNGLPKPALVLRPEDFNPEA